MLLCSYLLWREYSAFSTARANHYNSALCSTRYPSLLDGQRQHGMVCLKLPHVTSGGNWTTRCHKQWRVEFIPTLHLCFTHLITPLQDGTPNTCALISIYYHNLAYINYGHHLSKEPNYVHKIYITNEDKLLMITYLQNGSPKTLRHSASFSHGLGSQ